MTRVPDWVPAAAHPCWAGDHFAPAGGDLPLGDVPDGETVVIKLRQQTTVNVRANSVGRSGCSIKIHGQRAGRAVLHAPFPRVDVVDPAAMTLELTGSPVNLHIHTPGRLNLTVNQPTKVRTWIDDVDGNVAIVTGAPLTGLQGTVGTVTLQPTVDGSPVLDDGSHVALVGDLDAQRSRLRIGSPDRASSISGRLSCAVLESGSRVEVGVADLKAPNAQSNAAIESGVSLLASGHINVQGEVAGTKASPVAIELLVGVSATLGGPVSYCALGLSEEDDEDGPPAGDITLSSSSDHLRINGVKTVTSKPRGNHINSDFTAIDEISIHGPCTDVRRLQASRVQIKGTCTGRGTVEGDIITLGASQGSDDEVLGVRPGTSLHANVPAALAIEVPDGDGPVAVAIGTNAGPRVDLDPTDDGAFRAAVASNAPRGESRLSVRGPVVLALGRPTVLEDLAGAEVLAAGQSVELAAGLGPASIKSARIEGDLKVAGRGWHGDCLHVGKQVTGRGDLDITGELRAERVDTCTGSAGRLVLRGDLLDSHLAIDGDASIDGDVRHQMAETEPDEIRLTIVGEAAIGGECQPGLLLRSAGSLGGSAGRVEWHPGRPAELTIADRVKSLNITAAIPDRESPGETRSAELPTLDLGESGSVEDLTCQGAVRVKATKPSSRQPEGSRNAVVGLDLHDRSEVALDFSREYADPMKLHLSGGMARLHIARERAELDLVGDAAEESILELRGHAEVHAAASASHAEEHPMLLLDGAKVAIRGHISEVQARSRDGVDSTLTVRPEGTIHRLLGDVRLEDVQGRVTGVRPSRRARREAKGMSVPPRVLAVQKSLSGVLVGVDVSQLSLAEIQALEPLEVFSPAPRPLRRLAKQGKTPAERQEVAQKLATIASEVQGRAVSGSVRTKADWAVARAHHRIAPRPEWVVRWFSRAVGYSHRPLPALATVVAVVVLLAGSVASWESGSCEVEALGRIVEVDLEDYTLGENVQRLLGPTLSFLRLSSEGANFAPVWCNPFAQVGTTLAVLLPLLFLVIAMRHYLADPSDQR